MFIQPADSPNGMNWKNHSPSGPSKVGKASLTGKRLQSRFLIGFSRRTWARITSRVNAPFFMVTLRFTALSPRLRERLAPFLKNSYRLVGFPFSPTVNYQGTGCYPDVRVYSSIFCNGPHDKRRATEVLLTVGGGGVVCV